MKQDNFERALVLKTSHGLERILIARVFFMLIIKSKIYISIKIMQ